MRKLYLVLLVFLSVGVKAQYVTIPDANFVIWLNTHGFSQCMNGNLMDTTCPQVVNATILSCLHTNIQSLDGIQYFDNLTRLTCHNNNQLTTLFALPNKLRELSCWSNNLGSLPPLPDSLRTISCDVNQLISLPDLPKYLTYFSCEVNQLNNLPSLPSSLRYFFCGHNQLTSLPAVPDSLFVFHCGSNYINSLPILPNVLYELVCDNNKLSNLPSLPTSLRKLFCGYNNLSILPFLPDSLRTLHCDSNQLSNLSALPNNLEVLSCRMNQLSSLPHLPNALYHLSCDINQLTSLPELPDFLEFFDISFNPITCLPKLKRILSFNFNGTNVSCLPNYGEIGYSLPNVNSLSLCDSSDTNGCQIYWNINGKVFEDMNNNCLLDSLDKAQSQIKINLFSNGILQQQTSTNNEGLYLFDVSNFDTYSVSLDSVYLANVTCPDSGIYTITVTSNDSLFGNINFSIDTNISYVSLPDEIITYGSTIFPNPATTSVTISIDESMIGSIATISDITGRKMAAVNLTTQYSLLNTASFANGVYFVTVSNKEGRSATKKLVISH